MGKEKPLVIEFKAKSAAGAAAGDKPEAAARVMSARPAPTAATMRWRRYRTGLAAGSVGEGDAVLSGGAPGLKLSWPGQ